MLGKRLINHGGGVSCTTDTTQILDAQLTQSTALYRFEDNANDTASSTGKFNKGAVFNGSSSYINLGTSIAASTRAVSMWVYAYDFSERWPFQQGDGQGVENYIRFYNTDDIQVRWGNVTQTFSGYSANTWYHIVAQEDSNNNANVWINGVEMGSTGTPSAIAVNQTQIGRRYNNNSYQNYFNGLIDQVRVFNKAISASEVTTLYNETTTTANTLQVLGDTSCIAAYTFEGNANDLSTNYNGTASNVIYDYNGTASNITYATGKFGKAAVFNGSSSVVTINSLFDFSSSFSISMWFNADTLPSSTYIPLFFTDGYGGSNSDYGIALYLYGNTIKPWIDRQGTYTNIFTAGTLSTGTWYHVLLNRDYNSKWELFLNGSSLGTYTSAGLTDNYTPSSFSTIGKHANSALWFDGKIDQTRIFNKTLNTGEVNSLYNETTTSAALGTITNPSTVAYYKMADATDETGSYNGTATNVDFNVEGKYGFAGKFNGSGSYIQTSLALSSTDVTTSFWFNPDAINNNNCALYFNSHGGRIDIIIAGNSSNTSTVSGNNLRVNSTDIIIGNWSLCTVVFEGFAAPLPSTVTAKVYINGSFLNQVTPVPYAQTTGMRIGRSGGSLYYDGKIDQVRIFNKAISASEVTTLYNEIQCANTITAPESYFNSVLYTGNATSRSITTTFQPGFVWLKNRGPSARNHRLFDSVRGATKGLYSDLANEEYTENSLTAFNANGFTLGTAGNQNVSGENYVAWTWKAAASNTTNNDGTIESTVRASQESGFSIVQHTAPASGYYTVGHGLNKKPSLVITKSATTTGYNWYTWASALSDEAKSYLALDLNMGDGVGNNYNMWAASGSGFTSTTFGHRIGYSAGANNNQIAYCFANVDGYQRIGSYVGNGSANGPFIYTGFEPAWIMIKRTDAAGAWNMFDNKRNSTNPRNSILQADKSDQEYTNTAYNFNFYTNGFQSLNTVADWNASGGSYIFIAIAANPDTTAPTKTNSFKAITWAGSGAARDITTVGFKPDLVFWKARNNSSYNWKAINSISGASRNVYPNLQNLEVSDVATTAFIDNGFSFGSGGNGNVSSLNFVGYAWKGLDHDRNLAAINNDGSIPSIVSANPEAGFSAVKYNGTGNFTQYGVGHGLNVAPQVVIQKRLTGAVSNWYLITTVLDGSTDYFIFNDVDIKYDMSSTYANFTLGAKSFSDWWNPGQSIINFCFHSVDGYSRISSYTGVNGAKRVYTTDDGTSTGSGGFSPSFIIIRNVFVAGAWMVYDSARSSTPDPLNNSLMINYASQEVPQGTYTINVHSDGFTVNSNLGATNSSGNTYLYIAFA